MINCKSVCHAFMPVLFLILCIRSIPAQERNGVQQNTVHHDNAIYYDQTLSSLEGLATKEKQFHDKLPNVEDNPHRPTYVITIHRMIDGGLNSSIQRRVDSAKDKDAGLIIFDIDTFGGRLDAAMEISEFISDLKEAKQ